ncbi:MAG: S8 family serine peptidase [Archangium sp.]
MAPIHTTGVVRGEVRVFNESRAANASVPGSAFAREVLGRSTKRVDLEVPSVRGDVAVKTVPPVTRREAPFEVGAFIVGTIEPMTGAAIVAALRPERFGWTCEATTWASETMVLVRCAHADGSSLDEVETRAATDVLGRPQGVKFIELNHRIEASRVPNDPDYRKQWHYGAMSLPDAWDSTTGSADVVVAVLDTGIGAHADLTANLLPGIDLVSDVAQANDGNGRDDDPTDARGSLAANNGGSGWHGTHVAGTIAAASNNGVGVAGVAWNARVIPVRVLGKSGSDIDIIAGITWATGGTVPGTRLNNRVASVVNMSLGGDGAPSQAYQTAIDAAVARGAVIVVAAGNENENTANKVPCNQQRVICVAAADQRGVATGYTNVGAEVTITAPGGATDRDDDGDGNNDGVWSTIGGGGYARLQGTSMATPHVAGLVALMKTLRPSTTWAEARDVMVASATPVSNCRPGCGGAGNVDAALALARLSVLSNTGGQLSTDVSSVTLTSKQQRASVRLTNTGNAAMLVNLEGPSDQVRNIQWTPTAIPLPLAAGQSVTVDVVWVGDFSKTADVRMVFVANGVETPLLVRVRKPVVLPSTLIRLRQKVGGEWVTTRTTTADADGRFEFRGVTPGSYVVVANADDDFDGVFDDDESAGCWPTMASPQFFEVTAGAVVENRNFTVALSEAGPNVIGLTCGSNTQCQFGDECWSWPGGYCTRPCNGACGSGSTCVTFRGGEQYCMETCTGTGRGTCREDYECTTLDGARACLPAK